MKDERIELQLTSSVVKYWIRIDDSMDILAEHGVAGIVGLIFNALFASDAIVGLDGVNTGTGVGGWLIGNYKQLYIQIVYIVAASAYTFVVSALIAYAINAIPGLKLRASEEAELLGMDDDQLGEFAYDYVEVRRDYLAWTPQKHVQSQEGHDVSRVHLYGINEHSEMTKVPMATNGRPVSRPTPSGSESAGSQQEQDADPPPPSAPPPAVLGDSEKID